MTQETSLLTQKHSMYIKFCRWDAEDKKDENLSAKLSVELEEANGRRELLLMVVCAVLTDGLLVVLLFQGNRLKERNVCTAWAVCF